MSRLRAAVGGVEARLLAIRSSMTPGQRWTAGLALLLSCAVILFGQPRTG
jgi:hypothetical protein